MKFSKHIWISTITLALCLAPAQINAQVDGLDWTFRVNGQVVSVDENGNVFLPNVSAPDLFGPGGPGTVPDFVSDDLVRVIGFSDNTGGVPLYAFSEWFRIVQGESYQITNWTFTAVPPLSPESIRAVPEISTITALDQTPQVIVTATLADGTEVDATGAENWTSYRVSNIDLAEVDGNGIITPKAPGMIFVTAVNEGTTSTAQVDIALGDQLTTVDGFVLMPDGSPASGADIVFPGLAVTGTTGAQGQFSVTGVPTIFGQIGVLVTLEDGTQTLFGFATQLDPVLGGITDAGIISLDAPSSDTNIWLFTSGEWNDETHWSQGSVPDPSDDVVVPAFRTDSILTVSGGSYMVDDLESDAELEIASGSSLTVSGVAEVHGRFTMRAGSNLSGSGVGTSFTAYGPTNIDGGSVSAHSGAKINLPELVHYRHSSTGSSQTRSFSAEGFGSELNLGRLETVINGTDYNSDLRFEATSGGIIDLPELLLVVEETSGDSRLSSTGFRADGFGSRISMNNLRLLDDVNSDERSFLSVVNGGELQVAALRALQGVDLRLDGLGTFAAGSISEFTEGRLFMNRLSADFSSLTNATGTVFEVEGLSVTLENLEMIDGASFFVRLGGSLTLPGAKTYFSNATGSGQLRSFKAEGSGSILSLPNLTGIRNGDAYSADIEIEASAGGQVLLPMVTQMTDFSGDTRLRRMSINADGFGSLVDLSALISVIDANGDDLSQLSARNGGSVTLGSLKALQAVNISLNTLGSLDLSTVERFRWSSLTLDGLASDLNALTNAEYSSFAVQSTAVTLPNLTRIDGANFTTTLGGSLTLPAVQVYNHNSTGNSQTRSFRAEGAGSSLNLPALETIMNGSHYRSRITVEAISGGTINFSGLGQIVENRGGDSNERQVVVNADGFGSTIDLSGLRNYIDVNGARPSALTAINGGALTVDEGQLVLVNVDTTIDGLAMAGPIAAESTSEEITAQRADKAPAVPGFTRSYDGPLGDLIAEAMEVPADTDANAIRWISEEDGDWGVVTNWSVGRLPGPTDNVVIDVSNSDITVTISTSGVRVRGLACDEALVIAAGSLTVHGPSEINGGLTMDPGASLIASGEEATLSVVGETQVDGGNFVAMKGGQLDLPTVLEYSHSSTGNSQSRTFLAIETGSRIEFSGMTRFSNGTHYNSDTWFQALAGGEINLPQLVEIVDPSSGDSRFRQIILDARGEESAINFPAVREFRDVNNDSYSWIRALDGASIGLPLLKEGQGLQLISNGTGSLPIEGISDLLYSRVDISGVDQSMPLLRDATGTSFNVTGVDLSTPLLADVDGGSFSAYQGGVINLPAATSYLFASTGNNQSRSIQAIGAGSLVSLPNVLIVQNGTDYGSTLRVAALSGGMIEMPTLIEARDPDSGDVNLSTLTFEADGAGSQLDLSALVSMKDRDGGEPSVIQALNGGEILAPNLTDLQGTHLNSDGYGTVPTANLVKLTNGSLSVSGSALSFPQLVNGDGTVFTADGVNLVFPVLAFADGARFNATGGGQMTFPGLDRYSFASTGNSQGRSFVAEEGGSALSFPGLTDLRNGEHYDSDLTLLAYAGGTIDMPLLERLIDPAVGDATRRQMFVQVDGYNSTINVPLLAAIRDVEHDQRSLLSVTNRGILSAGSLEILDGVNLDIEATAADAISGLLAFTNGSWTVAPEDPIFTSGLVDVRGSTFVIDGHTVSGGGFSQIDGASFTVLNGGVLSLPGVTNYRHTSDASNQARIFRAEGSGSRIELPNLLSVINGTNYNADIRVQAVDGGVIDLSGLVQMFETTDGDARLSSFDVSASGAGSSVDLSALMLIRDVNEDERSTLVESDGGSITASQLVYADRVDLTLEEGSMLTIANLQEIYRSVLTFEGGTFSLPNLSRFWGSTAQVDGGSLTLGGLNNADASSFIALGGGVLSLPALSVYSHESNGNSQTRTFRAEGSGSRLEMPSLLSIINGTHYGSNTQILALEGGVVDLSSLGQIVGANSGDTRLRKVLVSADGANSTIDLTTLAHFLDSNADTPSSLVVANSGEITVDLDNLLAENVDFSTLPTELSFAAAISENLASEASGPAEDLGAGASVWLDVTELDMVKAFLETRAEGDPPATIVWVGEDGNWTDPENWDLERVPRANDSVLIEDSTDTLIITIPSGAQRIRSLQCEEDLVIAGGSLTVYGPGAINGDLTLSAGTTLVADGSSADVSVAGDVALNGANLYALHGATLGVPGLTNYNHASTANNQSRIFLSYGPGSSLELPDLDGITNGTHYQSNLRIEAVAGGTIELPVLTQLVDPDSGDSRQRRFFVSSDGPNSLINFPMLANFTDRDPDYYSELRSINGGEIVSTALREASAVYLNLNGSGSIDTDALINFTNGYIYLRNTASPSFPSLQNIAGTVVEVDDVDLVLTGVQNFNGGTVYASAGAEVTFTALITYAVGTTGNNQNRFFRATGEGSVIDFPSLQSVTLGTHYDSDLYIDAFEGGTVQLSKVLQFVESDSGDTRLSSIQVRSWGEGSSIDLTALVNFQDINSDERSRLDAQQGSVIISPALRDLRGVHLYLATGGSVDTGEFFNFVNGRIESRGEALTLPKLVTATGTSWVVDSADLTMPTVANANGGSFSVSGGGQLEFPNLVSYAHASTGNNQTRSFSATENGSILSFPGLLSITNGESYDSVISLDALIGGTIDLSSVVQIVDPSSGDTRQRQVLVYALGMDSEIDLTALGNFIDQNSDARSSLNASLGGNIITPALQTLQAVDVSHSPHGDIDLSSLRDFLSGNLTVLAPGEVLSLPALLNANYSSFSLDGGSLNCPELVSMNGANLTVHGGGSMAFPKLTTYSHGSTGNSQTRQFYAIEAGTLIDLSALEGITNGTHYNSDLTIQALVGAKIDLSSVLQIEDPTSGDTRERVITVRASGHTSVVDLSSLASFTDANADRPSVVDESYDGDVDYPAGATFTNVTLP